MTFWQTVAADFIAVVLSWGAGFAMAGAGLVFLLRNRARVRDWLDSINR